MSSRARGGRRSCAAPPSVPRAPSAHPRHAPWSRVSAASSFVAGAFLCALLLFAAHLASVDVPSPLAPPAEGEGALLRAVLRVPAAEADRAEADKAPPPPSAVEEAAKARPEEGKRAAEGAARPRKIKPGKATSPPRALGDEEGELLRWILPGPELLSVVDGVAERPAVAAAAAPPPPPAAAPSTAPGQPGSLRSLYTDRPWTSTPREGPCWEMYDFGMLDAWEREAADFCALPGGQRGEGTVLRCRRWVHPKLNEATRPHTLCDAERLVMDVEAVRPSRCLLHRPGYFCGDPTYFRFMPGAWRGRCSRSPAFEGDAFPRDHLRDVFDGFAASGLGEPPSPYKMAPVTPAATAAHDGVWLVVGRERDEHRNVYHSMTDWLAAFQALVQLGLPPPGGAAAYRVLLTDDHAPGPLDAVWARAFGEVTRVGDLRAAAKAGGPRFHAFGRVVFVPPGYSSILLAELGRRRAACHAPSGLVRSFARFMLDAHGVRWAAAAAAAAADAPVRVLFVVRRPYEGKDKPMKRMFANEGELENALAAVPGAAPRTVDFAGMAWDEQVAAVAAADAVVGMHGAGLAHLMWLPPHGGVLELRPAPGMGWHCFEHMAAWRGLAYRLWEAAGPERASTEVPAGVFADLAAGLVREVRERRQAVK